MTDTQNTPTPPVTDFHVHGGGTIYLLLPVTDEARAWVDENIGVDALSLGGSVAIEHRFIGDIVDGIRASGLTVR